MCARRAPSLRALLHAAEAPTPRLSCGAGCDRACSDGRVGYSTVRRPHAARLAHFARGASDSSSQLSPVWLGLFPSLDPCHQHALPSVGFRLHCAERVCVIEARKALPPVRPPSPAARAAVARVEEAVLDGIAMCFSAPARGVRAPGARVHSCARVNTHRARYALAPPRERPLLASGEAAPRSRGACLEGGAWWAQA